MRTYAQKPKATQQTTSVISRQSGRIHFGHSREVKSILHLQRAIGNHTVERLFQNDAKVPNTVSTGAASRYFDHNFSRIPASLPNTGAIQTKLAINKPGDEYEQEADRVSEQILRMPGPKLQRACACGGACRKCNAEQLSQKSERLQTKRVRASNTEQIATPPIVHDVLQSPGQPLQPATRVFMETRFGRDFSQVRAHYGLRSAESAKQVNARAYTLGQDIVFGAGQYAPGTRHGLALIAHELAHAIQQGGSDSSARTPGVLQRQVVGDEPMPEVPDPRDPGTKSAPKGKSWAGASAKCGKDFCRPWPTQRMAEDDRKALWPIFMAGILVKVSRRVIPLWTTWAFGGSSVQNLTKDFGADFRASKSTARTTRFLVGQLKSKLTSSRPAVPHGGSAKLDIATLIPAAVKAIDTPGDANEMNFNAIGEIPGNIAGGIGKDQKANPVGAKPSPQDDERIVKGDVSVTDAGGGSLMVVPKLNYTVKDTIDFCPGDCGAKKERIATIPMSRWEATGISGDVPFTVDFPGITVPFTIPAPAPAPAPKKP
jgi:hypothetical protein